MLVPAPNSYMYSSCYRYIGAAAPNSSCYRYKALYLCKKNIQVQYTCITLIQAYIRDKLFSYAFIKPCSMLSLQHSAYSCIRQAEDKSSMVVFHNQYTEHSSVRGIKREFFSLPQALLPVILSLFLLQVQEEYTGAIHLYLRSTCK